MRISRLVLVFLSLTCFLGTQYATSAETEAAAKTPDAAAVKKHMTPAQLALGDPITNSIGIVLVPIPSGEFMMGSPDSDKDAKDNEIPQRLAKITKPFYLGVCEVTQEQYEKIMGVRPWKSKDSVQLVGPGYSATRVSWSDAVEFCRKLSEKEGVEYRLPTEAQWEYACRAGTTTIYNFGEHRSKLGQHAWYDKNSWDIDENYAHRVGQKLPNSWGIYDMHGNVSEWCQDKYDRNDVGYDPNAVPASGVRRVLRGGSFFNDSGRCRSAFRHHWRPDYLGVDFGFRVARTYQ